MEISAILTADVLDIVFEGRNKEYGAYELRRSYRKRLSLSIAGMLLLIGLFITGYLLAGSQKTFIAKEVYIPPDSLSSVEKPHAEIIPPKHIEQPKQAMKQLTNVFRIVKEVKPDERPPEVTELEDKKIGTTNQEGVKDDGLTAPPFKDDGKGVVEIPKKKDDDMDGIFTKVEIESEYPGGPPAWQRYLNKNLHYPPEALDQEIQGKVVVQFIVDKEGNISEVQPLSGPEELRKEAVRVIKGSGKWTAAIQNGRHVKSYKNQTIIFSIGSE
jgi:protein TonB